MKFGAIKRLSDIILYQLRVIEICKPILTKNVQSISAINNNIEIQ